MGVSLLAMAECLSTSRLKINRYREQARSHRGFAVFLEPAMAFEMLIDLRRRHFLQAHQQIM